MAFVDSTSSQRIELLRQAEKTANLTRRVTVGSGVLGAPKGAEGGELCTALSEALADIGYGGLPAGAAVVPNAYALTGVAPTGTYISTVTFTVAGGVITGITLS